MRPTHLLAFVIALAVTTLARAAPDLIFPGDHGGGGGKLPVAPVVATSVLASIVAWVLALLRRRKRKANVPEGPARGANP